MWGGNIASADFTYLYTPGRHKCDEQNSVSEIRSYDRIGRVQQPRQQQGKYLNCMLSTIGGAATRGGSKVTEQEICDI